MVDGSVRPPAGIMAQSWRRCSPSLPGKFYSVALGDAVLGGGRTGEVCACIGIAAPLVLNSPPSGGCKLWEASCSTVACRVSSVQWQLLMWRKRTWTSRLPDTWCTDTGELIV